MSQVQRRVLISGRVQGVGFRAAAYREAKNHPSLRGHVRNLPDGRVEALFSGDAADVEAMVAWCRKGPALANVLQADVTEEPMDPSLGEFRIKTG